MSKLRVLRVLAPLASVLVLALVLQPSGSAGTSVPKQLLTGFTESEAADAGPDNGWAANRELADGRVGLHAFQRALEQRAAIVRTTEQAAPALAAQQWTFDGPKSVGGRVVDISVDPKTLNTVYVAAAGGGVWKSTDAAGHFQPAWPADLTQSIGAIAQGSDATLYVGTGEANPGGGSIVYGGTGVYRSSDGGAHWKQVGLPDSYAIGRIAVDPKDPKKVFVAASGPLFQGGGERGVYRSSDGGETWKQVLAGANDTTGASDVVIDPSDPKRVYAVMWDHLRTPDDRIYGGTGSGLYRSIDGGDTWKRIGDSVMPSAKTLGRIGVAVAPSDGKRLYAIASNTDGSLKGFYTSTDGGDTWSEGDAAGAIGVDGTTYEWWFSRISVDPLNPLHVFVAGLGLRVSRDGGTTFTVQNPLGLGLIHADQHAVVWDPLLPGRVYLGNDGGVYVNNAAGAEPSWVISSQMPWNQFYGVSVSEQDPTRIAGGAQDNGAQRSWGGKTTPVAPVADAAGVGCPSVEQSTCWDYNSFNGGDGLGTLINPKDQDNVFGCSQYGACVRSTDGGETTSGMSFGAGTCGWWVQMVFDPNDPNVMYAGCQKVVKSTDNGQSFTPISPNLSPSAGKNGYRYGTITTIDVAKTDPKTIWAGVDDGRLWRTTDGGASWKRITGLPPIYVNRVTVDPADANTVYVAFSGYRKGESSPHLMRTTDGGTTWTDISGDLPTAPVNDVVLAGDAIVAGTDVGVFASRDGGASWLAVGSGLPVAPIQDIQVNESAKRLYVATFGRGFWHVPVSAIG
jgi:photosystem II stability/assembly factor-like uncharacterized protein